VRVTQVTHGQVQHDTRSDQLRLPDQGGLRAAG
jgi:hypothetical protein